ncbi:chitin synthesis regulation, resistance to congo red-domain-containing protein [Whalleya microplaca]|nr:chitin synthesis regulation, resistance to congo red-domain-containing protein [Whalleya microplaca]
MAIINDQFSSRLDKRACPDGYYNRYGECYTAWSWYGRWIFAAVVIVVILLIFFLWACINARRRRRHGSQPMYGTGWMAGGPGQNQYYNNPQGYGQPQYGGNYPPPPYGGPQNQSYPMDNQYTGTTFRTNDGYYAQNEGVQPPKNVYNNHHNDDYAPPTGPPPTK